MTDASLAYVPQDIQSIIGVIDTHVRWRNNSKDRSYFKYHPSAFGGCLRNMQYMRYAAMGLIQYQGEEHASQTLRLFEKGQNMHNRWSNYFAEIGILRGVWECTNPCCSLWDDSGTMIPFTGGKVGDGSFAKPRIYGKDETIGVFKPERCVCGCRTMVYHEASVESEEMNMYGHVDAILDFTGLSLAKYDGVSLAFNMEHLPKAPIVVDFKTINDFRWKKMIKIGPDITYRIQLCIYANLLDVDFGLLIYENKNSSEVKAFKVEKATDTMFAEIKRQARTMDAMAKLDKPKLPPPRPVSKDDYECSKCGFKKMCHSSNIWDDEEKLSTQRKQFYGNLLE
jgi:hypothetical protein